SCGNNNYRSQTIGQDMLNYNSEILEAQSSGSGYELHLFHANHLSANHTGNFNPHRQAHGNKHLPKSLSQCQGDRNYQKQRGNGPSNINKPHDSSIYLSSIIACNGTQSYP